MKNCTRNILVIAALSACAGGSSVNAVSLLFDDFNGAELNPAWVPGGPGTAPWSLHPSGAVRTEDNIGGAANFTSLTRPLSEPTTNWSVDLRYGWIFGSGAGGARDAFAVMDNAGNGYAVYVDQKAGGDIGIEKYVAGDYVTGSYALRPFADKGLNAGGALTAIRLTWDPGTGLNLYLGDAPGSSTLNPVPIVTWANTDYASNVFTQFRLRNISQGGYEPAFDDVSVTGGAVTPQWNLNGTGDWNAAGNWAASGVPNAVDAVANFLDVATAPVLVYSNLPVTVGTLKFDNANKYLIGGLGSLTLQTSSTPASINVVQGSHEINLPLVLASNTNITTATGATLTIADPAKLASGVAVTKDGGGTLILLSTLNADGAATIKINGGVANFDAANNDPDISINIDPATVNLGASQTLGNVALSLGGNVLNVGRDSGGNNVAARLTANSLVVTGGGSADTLNHTLAGNAVRVAGAVQIDANSKLVKQGAGVLATGSLVIDSTGQLDLTNGKLIIDYTGSSPLQSDILPKLVSGRASGAWNGNGINSSSAAADSTTAIGYAEASQLGIGSFGGESVDGSAIVMRYTSKGDASLDGTVNSLDFTRLVAGYGITSNAGWAQGDFNYDGKVNTLDFNDLAGNFGTTIAAPALGSVVPEPGTLSLAAAVMLFLRRRRQS